MLLLAVVERGNTMEKNYEFYSNNALDYFNSVDNYKTMNEFLKK